MRATARGWRDVATFALSGLVAVIVLGVAGFLFIAHTSTGEATRNAKALTRLAGRGIVAPSLTAGVLRGEPAAIEHLDRIVRSRILRDPVVRVKIWTAQGRIIYSDEHALIGSRYPLGDDEGRALRSDRTAAEVSDLTRPENRFERSFHKLLEVYLPIAGPHGTPLLFETYQRFSVISARSQRLLLDLAPALVGALLLLWAIQVPLAARLARRLREGQREREELLQRAIESSEMERRRVARDLHDGAVQNLSGIAWSLSATAAEAPPEIAQSLQRASAETRRTIKELRSLLVDIYPPDLHRTGVEAAVNDLVAAFGNRGITATVDFPPQLELPQDAEALIFRVAQEAVRNTVAHADAHNVTVRVRIDRGIATLVVADDGRGFPTGEAAGRSHFGLRMIRDLARDAGSTLDVRSAPGSGTTVSLAVPIA